MEVPKKEEGSNDFLLGRKTPLVEEPSEPAVPRRPRDKSEGESEHKSIGARTLKSVTVPLASPVLKAFQSDMDAATPPSLREQLTSSDPLEALAPTEGERGESVSQINPIFKIASIAVRDGHGPLFEACLFDMKTSRRYQERVSETAEITRVKSTLLSQVINILTPFETALTASAVASEQIIPESKLKDLYLQISEKMREQQQRTQDMKDARMNAAMNPAAQVPKASLERYEVLWDFAIKEGMKKVLSCSKITQSFLTEETFLDYSKDKSLKTIQDELQLARSTLEENEGFISGVYEWAAEAASYETRSVEEAVHHLAQNLGGYLAANQTLFKKVRDLCALASPELKKAIASVIAETIVRTPLDPTSMDYDQPKTLLHFLIEGITTVIRSYASENLVGGAPTMELHRRLEPYYQIASAIYDSIGWEEWLKLWASDVGKGGTPWEYLSRAFCDEAKAFVFKEEPKMKDLSKFWLMFSAPGSSFFETGSDFSSDSTPPAAAGGAGGPVQGPLAGNLFLREWDDLLIEVLFKTTQGIFNPDGSPNRDGLSHLGDIEASQSKNEFEMSLNLPKQLYYVLSQCGQEIANYIGSLQSPTFSTRPQPNVEELQSRLARAFELLKFLREKSTRSLWFDSWNIAVKDEVMTPWGYLSEMLLQQVASVNDHYEKVIDSFGWRLVHFEHYRKSREMGVNYLKGSLSCWQRAGDVRTFILLDLEKFIQDKRETIPDGDKSIWLNTLQMLVDLAREFVAWEAPQKDYDPLRLVNPQWVPFAAATSSGGDEMEKLRRQNEGLKRSIMILQNQKAREIKGLKAELAAVKEEQRSEKEAHELRLSRLVESYAESAKQRDEAHALELKQVVQENAQAMQRLVEANAEAIRHRDEASAQAMQRVLETHAVELKERDARQEAQIQQLMALMKQLVPTPPASKERDEEGLQP